MQVVKSKVCLGCVLYEPLRVEWLEYHMGMSNSKEESLRAAIRKNDLGDGVEVSIVNGEESYSFSNKKPSFKGLEVEVSSVQSDDDSLLKKLSQAAK